MIGFPREKWTGSGRVLFSIAWGDQRLGLVQLPQGYWFFGFFRVVQ